MRDWPPLKKQVICMDWAPKALSFVISGASTNWWGLGWPSHCFAAGPSALLGAFLLGLLSGLLVAALICFWGLGFFSVSVPVPGRPSPGASSPPSDRVRAYLNEQSLSTFSRRRRGTIAFPGVPGATDLDQGQR